MDQDVVAIVFKRFTLHIQKNITSAVYGIVTFEIDGVPRAINMQFDPELFYSMSLAELKRTIEEKILLFT